MVRVGVAGIGFMGVTHFKAYQNVNGGQVAAIFTRDEKKLAGDWSGVQGNFGDSGGVQDLTGVKQYRDLDQMLADPDLDLIDVCLPSHLHREVTVQALQAGKHVLVEKPIALTVEDADAMTAAAESAGKLLMVAQVLRFWPEFAAIKDIKDEGKYGRLLAAHFKRVITLPDWSKDKWFEDASKNGGAVVDLHIHDTDFIRYLCGDPEAVTSLGVVAPQGMVNYLVTEYDYGNDQLCVTAQSGSIAQKAVQFEHGYDIYFERAMLRHNSNLSPGIQLFEGSEGPVEIQPRIEDAFTAQLQAAVDGVASGQLPDAISGRSARESLRVVLAEGESAKTGRRVDLS